MHDKRRAEYGVLKGILIVLVVIGHSYPLGATSHYGLERWEDYIYLFHMPAFFIVGGMVYDFGRVGWEYIAKKAKRLLVPYCIYVGILGGGAFVVRILSGKYQPSDIPGKLIQLLLGDKTLSEYYLRPLWFLPAYFATIALFTMILMTNCKSLSIRLFSCAGF